MQTMYEVCLHACLLHHILYTYICVGACNEHLCLHAMRLQLSLERDSLISVGGAHTCHSCSLFFSTAVWASSGRCSHVSGSACKHSLVSSSSYFLKIFVWASSGRLKKNGEDQQRLFKNMTMIFLFRTSLCFTCHSLPHLYLTHFTLDDTLHARGLARISSKPVFQVKCSESVFMNIWNSK